MYELNRILLRSYGPFDARYEYVDLDFSGTGAPIPMPPLVPLPGQVLHRPSPVSLLVLENGGGKGVLLTGLLSSVIPYRHQTEAKALRGFESSPAQPSHIVLEWTEVTKGTLLVTSHLFTKRKDGSLDRRFYCFSPNAMLTADALPFHQDGHWLTFDDYLTQLLDLQARNPALELHIEEGKERWERHEQALGLEPDLFDVQRRMNAKESGAADAVPTTTPGGFVEWLLRKAVDPDTYESLGNMFNRFSANRSENDHLRTERTFSLSVKTHAAVVARHACTHQTAHAAEEHATTALTEIASAVHALQSRTEATVTELTGTLDDAAAEASTAHENLQRAQAIGWHVATTASDLELADLRATRDKLKSDHQEAVDVVDAWHAVPAALKLSGAEAAHVAAQRVLTDAQTGAAPFVLQRDLAAARLRAGHQRAEQDARAILDALDEADQKAAEQARTRDDRVSTLRVQEGVDKEKTGQANTAIRDYDQALAAARQVGVVAHAESASQALARLRSRTEQLALKLGEQTITERRVHTELIAAMRTQAAAATTAERAAAAADARRAAVSQAAATALSLAGDPMVTDLLEIQASPHDDHEALLWLDSHVATLNDLATKYATQQKRLIGELQTAISADQRLLDLLDASGGLRPAREPVRHLCDLLTGRGIPAHPGWQWLHDNVPAVDHAAFIARHPDLIDGIIVPDQTRLDAAHALLTQERPFPSAAIAVGIAERLHDDSAAEGRFVAEPNPALHDQDAASREQQQIAQRLDANTEEVGKLGPHLEQARLLLSQLDAWRRTLCGVPVPQLLSDLLQAETDKKATNKASQAAAEVADSLEVVHQKAADDLKELRDAHQATYDQLPPLQSLVDQEAAAHSAEDMLEELGERATTRARELAQLKDEDVQAERDALARGRAREAAERQAADHAHRRDEIVTTPDAIRAVQTEPLPPAPLPELQQRYTQAETDLHAVQVGDDLHEAVKTAADQLRTAQQTWSDIAHHIQATAWTLKDDRRAADSLHRDAITREHAAKAAACSVRLTELATHEAQLTTRMEQQSPAVAQIELTAAEREQWTPHSPPSAVSLRAKADAKTAAARHAKTTADSRQAEVKGILEQHKATLSAVTTVWARLEGFTHDLTLTDDADTDAVVSLDHLTEAARTAITDYQTARKDAAAAERKLNSAVARLKEAAIDVSYEGIDLPLRRQISALDSRHIPGLAEEWETELSNKVASIDMDLAVIAEAHEKIVKLLAGHVSNLLRMLGQATRFSTFPDDSDTVWAGQPFLSITYATPGNEALHDLLRMATDELSVSPRAAKMAGVDLVMRCLHKAVPGGFTVTVLKPTPANRSQRRPIADMAEIFSGGQELTSAILIYCTLAALKTSPTGRTRTRHGGLLLLDNPLGRANADYLVRLQHEMAAALGIQLICTTGLGDDHVTTIFPLRIQLRNDASARDGLAILSVTDRIANHLLATHPETPDPAGTPADGYISTAHLHTNYPRP
ncbi:hypothetical protein OHR68_30295 [Spirillospora sp. NBC_00431]